MLVYLAELLGAEKPKLHPADILCPALAKLDSNITLKFIAFTRDKWRGDTYGRWKVEGRKNFAGYFPITNGNAEKHLSTLVRHSKYKEGGISPNISILGDESCYIPMADFVGRPTEYDFQVFANKLSLEFLSLRGKEFFVFDSGNSYHGYVAGVLPSFAYTNYEHLLKDVPFVDQLWVEAGMQCLRWTKGKGRGRKLPKLKHTFIIGENNS